MRDEAVGGRADSMGGMAESVGDGSESVSVWGKSKCGGCSSIGGRPEFKVGRGASLGFVAETMGAGGETVDGGVKWQVVGVNQQVAEVKPQDGGDTLIDLGLNPCVVGIIC